MSDKLQFDVQREAEEIHRTIHEQCLLQDLEGHTIGWAPEDAIPIIRAALEKANLRTIASVEALRTSCMLIIVNFFQAMPTVTSEHWKWVSELNRQIIGAGTLEDCFTLEDYIKGEVQKIISLFAKKHPTEALFLMQWLAENGLLRRPDPVRTNGGREG